MPRGLGLAGGSDSTAAHELELIRPASDASSVSLSRFRFLGEGAKGDAAGAFGEDGSVLSTTCGDGVGAHSCADFTSSDSTATLTKTPPLHVNLVVLAVPGELAGEQASALAANGTTETGVGGGFAAGAATAAPAVDGGGW